MPLIKSILEVQILAALQNTANSSTSLEDSQRQLAQDLATAIDSYIRTATIITQPGQVVTTPAGPGVTSTPSLPATIT